jgi:hypothetical protein
LSFSKGIFHQEALFSPWDLCELKILMMVITGTFTPPFFLSLWDFGFYGLGDCGELSNRYF